MKDYLSFKIFDMPKSMYTYIDYNNNCTNNLKRKKYKFV